MNIHHVRELLSQDIIELEFSLPHALVEARKDGLTEEDLIGAVLTGEVVEDYGERALLLSFTTEYKIPSHVVLEYVAGDSVATVLTAYIPSRDRWEANWKTRRKTRKKRFGSPSVGKRPKK